MDLNKVTREELIFLAEEALKIKSIDNTFEVITAYAQLGQLIAWLKLGCDYEIITKGSLGSNFGYSNEDYIFLRFQFYNNTGLFLEATLYTPTYRKIVASVNRDWAFNNNIYKN